MSYPKPTAKTGDTFLDEPWEVLLSNHASNIAALRSVLESLATDYDDIALVRYLLGFGTVQHAANAIRAAEEVKLKKAAVLAAAKAGEPLSSASLIEPHQKLLAWRVSEERALYVISLRGLNSNELLRLVTVDDIEDYLLWLARCVWLWVDQTSRSLGRLRKYDVAVDFFGVDFSWDKIPPSRYRKAMSQVAEYTGVLHPLAQGFNAVIGLPGAALAKKILRFVMPMMPRTLTDSVTTTQICTGNRLKQPITACPFLAREYGANFEASLPDFTQMECPVTGNFLYRPLQGHQKQDESQLPNGGLHSGKSNSAAACSGATSQTAEEQPGSAAATPMLSQEATKVEPQERAPAQKLPGGELEGREEQRQGPQEDRVLADEPQESEAAPASACCCCILSRRPAAPVNHETE